MGAVVGYDVVNGSDRAMTQPAQRRASIPVDVGGVIVGGSAPIVVQSMTNTDTADAEGTAQQTADLARAGSEIVRITVDRDEAAKAVPRIRERLLQMGVTVPLVGDFHYNGHTLLAENSACAEALDKYRINPGNVGFKNKRDLQFGKIIDEVVEIRFRIVDKAHDLARESRQQLLGLLGALHARRRRVV